MKINAEYIFDADLQRTIDVCVHQVIGNAEYFLENMQNVSSVKVVNRKDHPDGRIDVAMDFCAHGQIPKAVQHILTPKMLTWRETSSWDPATKKYIFSIRTNFFTNLFSSKGYWLYTEKGPNKSSQACFGDLKINIPIFGSIIEQAIWKELKKNWDESYHAMKKKNGI